jgi:hypothetical protein
VQEAWEEDDQNSPSRIRRLVNFRRGSCRLQAQRQSCEHGEQARAAQGSTTTNLPDGAIALPRAARYTPTKIAEYVAPLVDRAQVPTILAAGHYILSNH